MTTNDPHMPALYYTISLFCRVLQRLFITYASNLLHIGTLKHIILLGGCLPRMETPRLACFLVYGAFTPIQIHHINNIPSMLN